MKRLLLLSIPILALAGFLLIPPAPVPARTGEDAYYGGLGAASNAFPYYRKAADALQGVKLEARDWEPLTAEQRAALAGLRPALDIAHQAGKRPRSEGFQKPPSSLQDFAEFQGFEDLAQALVLESRRLEAEGDRENAVRVALVAYKMGTEIAEPTAPLSISLKSLAVRRAASQALYEWMARGGGGYDLDVEVTQSFGYFYRTMPETYLMLQWEIDANERALQEVFVQGSDLPAARKLREGYWWSAFPGLRLRAYNSAIAWLRHCYAVQEPLVKAWDFEGLRKAYGGLQPPSASLGDQLAGSLNRAMTSVAEFPLEKFYADRAREQAFTGLAGALAWKARHGSFPDTLKTAMDELGLPVPVDPATQQPVGYRLEDGFPVVSLPGDLEFSLKPR